MTNAELATKLDETYPNGAECLNPACGRIFSPKLCREYGVGEGDQPDTCPTCGARIEPADPKEAI